MTAVVTVETWGGGVKPTWLSLLENKGNVCTQAFLSVVSFEKGRCVGDGAEEKRAFNLLSVGEKL